MHSLLLPCLQVAKEQKQRGVFGSNACALPKLRPAPFFCHEKAHMHSELLCKQQKGQRLSEIPHRAQINTRSPINFSPSHPDWERSEVEGLLPVLRVAARCCPHPCDTGAPHPTAPYHSSPCSPPGQWVAHGGGDTTHSHVSHSCSEGVQTHILLLGMGTRAVQRGNHRDPGAPSIPGHRDAERWWSTPGTGRGSRG